MRSLDEYLTPISGPDEPQAKPAHIPFTKLAGPLAGSPWSPLHGVASALAKTKIGRGAVKGAGIDVPQGQAPSGEDLARVPLSILEDFTTPGNAALLAASMVPGVAVGRLAAAKRLSSPLGVLAQGAHAVGHTAGAALIPGMAVTAADDLGNLGSALITGDMERVGEIAPHAAVNAGMLGMVGHG
ncbi:MAG TPA: hypothetical protein PK413_13040, partial [Thermoanaerobaculia bacterium]|nr:hypothetical protein [Thermoanaerobaculia bacterium]